MLGFRHRGGARTHMPAIAAIRESGLLRCRPIPMATAAAIDRHADDVWPRHRIRPAKAARLLRGREAGAEPDISAAGLGATGWSRRRGPIRYTPSRPFVSQQRRAVATASGWAMVTCCRVERPRCEEKTVGLNVPLLGCGHRVPEVTVAKRRVLRIRQSRQTRQILDQPGGRFGACRVARPRIVA